ncbi:MAG: hypothetical protein J6M95_01600 [Bacilli bacterium]|nr:hypothetical protein [Bacilli bacterium]
MYKKDYIDLLRQFADSLINSQFPSLGGGLFCSSCKVIHGRCIDAIYGLSIAYKTFKDEKYLDAIRGLLDYSKNLICDDGGIYNDLQTDWRYTTVFYVIDIVETLNSCKDILPRDIVSRLEGGVKIHSKWLFNNLDENSYTNINYPANNVLALFLSSSYLGNKEYLSKASYLADYVLKHISTNNLLFGEGKPHSAVTERGCYAIDIGYNLEETLPALSKYAYLSKNEGMLSKLYEVSLAHLEFILPDGAIDNSFSCRNYKWTYYGSRTCDGIIPMCFIFGKRNPLFYEAAKRNTRLIRECTHDGYLYGGPMYFRHLEKPCIHQTFEHLNSIAYAVDHLEEIPINNQEVALFSDLEYNKYYPEFDSYRIGNKNYLLDITCYDNNISYSGHASGATLSMLYSRKDGPLIMGSVGEYQLTEPTNMQVPLKLKTHRPLLPRIEVKENRKIYSSCYYTKVKKLGGLHFGCGLMSRDGEFLANSQFDIEYVISDDRVIIKINNLRIDSPLLFPLISGEVKINKGKLKKKEEIFFLTPGFIATEYEIEKENESIEIEVK